MWNHKKPDSGSVSFNNQVEFGLPDLLIEGVDVEDNIQEAFIDLPNREQQWITNRLELLKDKLIKFR